MGSPEEDAAAAHADALKFPTCAMPRNSTTYVPPVGACSATAAANKNLTLADAQKIGWRYAPYLWHHPLEQYHLSYVITL